jgi:hypothetical protein
MPFIVSPHDPVRDSMAQIKRERYTPSRVCLGSLSADVVHHKEQAKQFDPSAPPDEFRRTGLDPGLHYFLALQNNVANGAAKIKTPTRKKPDPGSSPGRRRAPGWLLWVSNP